jgi:cellulose synthase/poly-beta-1,6-N-acetylglucosamine synthase-like glycosyltransferase
MRRLAAVVHTHDDGLRLGRCLETLHPCDEILIVDHGSRDRTVAVARAYGAQVIAAGTGLSAGECLQSAAAEWVICLDPRESMTEGLAASLFEWKLSSSDSGALSRAFSVFLREETAQGWREKSAALTRIVPAGWQHWDRFFPAEDPGAQPLDGELLRFAFP